jgi:hypothetical protein
MAGTKNSDSLGVFWLRLLVAGVVVKGIISGTTAAFAEWTDKPDWVLEYRYWIIAGTYLIALAIGVGIMVLSRPKQSEADNQRHL